MSYRSSKPLQSVKNQPGSFFPKQPYSPAKSHIEHFRSENPTPHNRKQQQAYPPRQESFNLSSGESLEQFHRKRQNSNFSQDKKAKNQLFNILFNKTKRNVSFCKDTMKKQTLQNPFNNQGQNWYLPSKSKLSQTMQKKPPKINNSMDGQQTVDISFENILIKGYQDHSGFQSDTTKPAEDYNPRSIKLFEKGKQLLREKQIDEAIEQSIYFNPSLLKKCIEVDTRLLEGHYFLGIGYLGTQLYQKAIAEFQYVIQQDAVHRKNIYLLLAISHKKMNELDQAIQILNKVITMFPRYYDAYIYRGKLHTKLNQIDKADQDFNIAIQLSPQKGLGYLGKADCLRMQCQYKEAIKYYQKAINCEQAVGNAAILKKAITLYESQQYEECAKDLSKLLETDPTNSEAYYFKGLSRLKIKNNTEALLCFEQAIKHNNSKKAVTKSLYEIARMKLEQRDFYAAYHTLNRSSMLDTEKSYLEKFKLFTEAVIFLMKRKFQDSMLNFQEIQNNHQLNDFLKPLFYAYRAYGQFCLSKHQKALDDYKYLLEIQPAESSVHYNKFLCEGILKVQSGLYTDGMELFQRAQKIFQKKMEPTFYLAVTYINQSFKKKNDQYKDVIKGLELLDKANSMNDQNANLYYVRSIVKCFLGQVNEALMDIESAISKSEDNVAKYFYFRGIVFGILKQYKHSLNDFGICLTLDETFADAYLNRAKCHFLNGDSNSAFQDLQSCIQILQDDPRMHIWADAIKAYSNNKDFKNNPKLLQLRAECYMVLGDLNQCSEDINRLYKLTKEKTAEFDKDMLQALRIIFKDDQQIYFNEESENEYTDFNNNLNKAINILNQLCRGNGKLFQQFHVYIFRGVFLFHQEKYEAALRDFQMAKSQKELSITEKKLKQRGSQTDIFQEEEFHELTVDEEDADLLEILEIKFNELICLVILKQYKKAKEKCKQLIENINEAKQEGLQILLMHIEQILMRNQQDIDYQRVICLYDEPKENIICFQVPIVFVDGLKIRLSFSLPKLSPPSLSITFDKSLVQDLGPLSVENKPEAPWIRREQQDDMIIFTENVQLVDDIRLETEKDDEQPQQQQQMLEITQIKNNLMLDKDIEEKLQRFFEKKNKQK
ncbi:unnamed protein product (macronuclear) [Paramecium tetraurelia]|uniref:Uncharacterized protein n=1 Tax=Paramecium tetraurelia TaxID=5888 RepID=A0CVZ0_PARTE|nr:uncharacterized protein GSPATT00001159001 [Paramecium tetraurelia]CAK74957.1 unnamed protein product [Paramecium tetraurelia]|eukprot:XP_001442354.1 hypothetical protein (macronuclear) [Paramecium tetraurelia strain d4-2]